MGALQSRANTAAASVCPADKVKEALLETYLHLAQSVSHWRPEYPGACAKCLLTCYSAFLGQKMWQRAIDAARSACELHP